eukprot:7328816-Prymnesium_polylepis.1
MLPRGGGVVARPARPPLLQREVAPAAAASPVGWGRDRGARLASAVWPLGRVPRRLDRPAEIRGAPLPRVDFRLRVQCAPLRRTERRRGQVCRRPRAGAEQGTAGARRPGQRIRQRLAATVAARHDCDHLRPAAARGAVAFGTAALAFFGDALSVRACRRDAPVGDRERHGSGARPHGTPRLGRAPPTAEERLYSHLQRVAAHAPKLCASFTAMLAAVSRRWPAVRIVLSEALYNHFPGASYNIGGRYPKASCTVLSPRMRWEDPFIGVLEWLSGEGRRAHGLSPSTASIVPGANGLSNDKIEAFNTWLGTLPANVGEQDAVRVLRLAELFRGRGDAHTEWAWNPADRGKTHRISQRDCLHLCVAPSVTDARARNRGGDCGLALTRFQLRFSPAFSSGWVRDCGHDVAPPRGLCGIKNERFSSAPDLDAVRPSEHIAPRALADHRCG